MKNLILIGAGGHAKSLIDLIESSQEWKIMGLIGNREEVGKSVLGYKIIGDDSDLELIKNACENALIAIGQIKNCEKRKKLANKLDKFGFKFPVIKSKFCYVSKHSEIGRGTTIGHGAIINSNVVIGQHCIINSQSLIEHDSKVDEFCHISTGSLINGGAIIGKESFVGSNTLIRENITIPKNSIISAGKRIMYWPLD